MEKISNKDYIDRLCSEYIDKHVHEQERDELIQENNIEKRDIKGYHGREILELLQNADDAYQKSIDLGEKPNCELEVTITYKNNILTVTNTGTFFDKEGIKAIVQGNNSPKSGKYIGNKGTGFRSILNWANKVKIFSGDFNIEFSKDIADQYFELIRNEPQIKKQLEKNPDLYIPMLAVPTNIDSFHKAYITTIEVTIDPYKLNDDFSVLKQLQNIDLRILLFLPNISKIDIITDDNHIIYKKFNNDSVNNIKRLQKIVDDNIETEEKFCVFNKTITNAIKEDERPKDIQLSVAVPLDVDAFNSKNIYSYFPLLDTESPFNCVLHATYVLGDHRNTVNDSQVNKDIIKEQLLFLIGIARIFVKNGEHDIAHKILLPKNFASEKWTFSSPFSKFELEEYYLELLLEEKIFLTVNNKNISIKDVPKMLKCKYPSQFVGDVFNNLLKPIDDENITTLIEVLAKQIGLNIYFEEQELVTTINKISNLWDVSEQVEIFMWWNEYYRDYLPHLLKTQDSKWLKFQEECFFLIGDFDTKGLPSWVRIPALHRDYQQELFVQAEKSKEVIKIKERDKEPQISRVICQNNIYPTVNFKYRDRSNIISTVNSSVDTYNKAVDFVRWLWENYKQDADWSPPGRNDNTSFKYNFPSENKSIKDSEKLFFGALYDNYLAAKLFDESCDAFSPSSLFSICSADKELFKTFISKFGVKDYPLIESQSVYPLDSYSNEYEKEIKKNGDLGASTYASCKYYLPYIKNLEYLLMKLSTLEVVEWIIKDPILYAYLSNPFYTSDAKITYEGNLQHYARQYNGKIKNYILEVFNEVKWIELDDERYSPREVLQNINSRNNQKFVGLIPTIGVGILENIALKLKTNFENVNDVFEKFSFADKITELSSDDFYGLLLKIPSIDFSYSVDLSKSIFRIIEQPSFTREFSDSDNKDKFFREGKILVKYKGKLQYYLAKDAFLPSSKIISKKNVPIIEKGQRTNSANFIKIFGCQEYNKEYSIVTESISIAKANVNFRKYFQEFSKYARAYAENNDNIERYAKKIFITLVDAISIIENGNTINIDEEYMCIRDTMTNWYITVWGQNFDINNVSEIIENIYSNIANTPGFESGKLGELFRTKDKSDREFLIKKEFGSLDVIEDEYYQNEIRNNFIKALKTIAPTFVIDETKIDFDNFSSINNAPYIIELFKQIGTDVEQFENAGFVYTIDLVQYYKVKLSNFIQNEIRQFTNVLFTRAKGEENLQNDFINTINRFRCFKIKDISNSVNFDIEERVVKQFGKWKNENNILSASDEYSRNYEIINPNNLCEDEISIDIKAQQMIYFERTSDFNNWIKAHQKQKQVNSGEDENVYSRYTKIVPKVLDIEYRQSSSMPEDNSDKEKVNSSIGTFIYTCAEKRRKNQKIFGNKGELLVYNLLCEQVGEENVFPRSEAFVELGIIKPGQAISGEYDISYIDIDGVEYFVEVKTGNGKTFIISPGELQFAQENAEKYKVFLVYNVDDEEPICSAVPAKFWEDPRFRKHEIIERIEFEF